MAVAWTRKWPWCTKPGEERRAAGDQRETERDTEGERAHTSGHVCRYTQKVKIMDATKHLLVTLIPVEHSLIGRNAKPNACA